MLYNFNLIKYNNISCSLRGEKREDFENETVDSVIEKYVETKPAVKEEKSQSNPLTKDDKEIIHKKKVEGVTLFNQNKYEEAIKVFETVLLLNPNDEVYFV